MTAAPASTRALADCLRGRLAGGLLDLPRPGCGATWRRWQALAAAAADDLSLARLVEGHVDALAILREAGREPAPGLYGVFAARGPDSTVAARQVGANWCLEGRRRYASGVRVLDRALVDVDGPDGSLLVDLDLHQESVVPEPGTWQAVGMAATDSVAVALDGAIVAGDDVVGPTGFYVERPGFGHGGAGVAACWWGGAVGLVRDLAEHAAARPAGERRREVVAAAIVVDGLGTLVRAAADDLDREPDDRDRSRHRAASLRWAVNRGCREVLARAQAGGGTHPATTDAGHARRLADLPVYLTQFGGQATLDGLDPRTLVPDLREIEPADDCTPR